MKYEVIVERTASGNIMVASCDEETAFEDAVNAAERENYSFEDCAVYEVKSCEPLKIAKKRRKLKEKEAKIKKKEKGM